MLWWFAQTTLIAGALAVVAALASRWKRLGAEARHALWLIVLIKLAIPPVVAWPWRVPDAWPSKAEPAPVAVAVALPPVAVVEEVAPVLPPPRIEPMTPAPAPLPAPRVEAAPLAPLRLPPSPEEVLARAPVEAPVVLESPDSGIAKFNVIEPKAEIPDHREGTISDPGSPISDSRWEIGNLQSLILGLWLVGSVVVVVRRAIKIIRFQRSLSDTIPAPDWLIEESRIIGERVGVRPPPVVMTSKVMTPLLWCLGWPRLILPEALVKRLEADRWAGILAHELAHLARLDHWVVRLELLVEAVWWWNPLFWQIRKKLHEEAELACDARVIRSLPDRRFAYAEALVDVCEHLAQVAIPSPSLGVGGAGASRSLEGRLLMILRDPIPSRPSKWAALGVVLLAALALPSWTLGRQEPDKPKAEASPKVETPAPKPDEPKPDPTPQPFPPGVKPSAQAAEASIETIQQAQANKKSDLSNLSFRYVVASRERSPRGVHGMEPNFRGMGGGLAMQGMVDDDTTPLSLPPRSLYVPPGGLAANVPLAEPWVRLEVADVFLAFDENNGGYGSRVDFFEARPEPLPLPGGGSQDFAWDRRFVAKDVGSTMALEMAWDRKGAVPFRWLSGQSNSQTHGDSLNCWFAGNGSSLNLDAGLDPLDPRPENLLDLAGSTRVLLRFKDVARCEVAGVDLIDGREAVRVAWIGSSNRLRGICWYSPELDFALVRFDATQDAQFNFAPQRGRMTWRKRSSDFVKVGDHWLPGKVSYEEIEANPNGGEPVYHKELIATFENFQQVEAPPANAFRPKMAVQGLDDKSGQFTALPPEIPGGIVDRLKKAVQASPFGPPLEPKVASTSPVEVAPAIVAQPGPLPGPVVEVPAPAKAEPGIVVEPKPESKAPIAVADPKQGEPVEAKAPADPAAIDRAIEDRFKADPEVIALAKEMLQAQEKFDAATRSAKNEADPAVRNAKKKLDEFKDKYDQLWNINSSIIREAQEQNLQARDAVDLLLIRRDRKAADVRKAEALKGIARAVVARNSALLKKNPNLVSQEEVLKAEAELAVAEAEVESKQTELAEAELLVTQARRRLEGTRAPQEAAKAPVDGPEAAEVGRLQDRREAVAALVANAKERVERARARNARLKEGGAEITVNDIQQAVQEAERAEVDLRSKLAELADLDRILNQAGRGQTLTEPREPKAVSVDTASADILQARRDARAADLQKAEGQKRVAAIALERTKELVAKNAVPQSQCQKCEAELEIAEAQVTGKKAELAEADILLNRAKQAVTPSTKPVEPSGFSSTLSELRDAAELIEIQLQVKQAEHRGAKSQGDREVKEVEFREYQLRLKQAKRRVEFEEARLKREIDRVRDRLDWSEKMHKQGYVSRATYLADRKSYDELMFQLDPKYVAPKPEPEPQADAARPAAEIDAQAELAVKLIGEAKRFTGQNISYKIQVSNTGRMPATDVRVGVTLPKEGGKLIALPSSSKFDVQNRKLRWFIPRVEPGQTIDLAFAYGTSTPGSYRASVQVSSDQAPLAEDRLLTEVQAIAALDLNVTQQSRIVDVGKHNIYDITIKNVGSKPVNRVQVNGKLTKNLKLIKAFNIDKGELKFNPELGEFVFPEIEVLPVGKTITLNLEVEPLESGPAGCHVFLGHAEMLPGEPMTEDTVSTTVTKKAEDDPKK